jgi:hypothetical protein
VPGVEETPARVVWREGDGFVGWAPEPPDWLSVSDDDVDYEDGLDWVFTLLGTLVGDRPDQNALSGDAEKKARSATAPARARDGSFTRKQVGPTASSIHAARAALTEYVLRHPDAIAAALKTSGGKADTKGSEGSKKSSSSSSSSSSSNSSSKSKADASFTVGVAPMPFAMTYYDAFLMEPAVAPRALVPDPRPASVGVDPAPHAERSVAAASVGNSGAHAHGAAGALRSSSREPASSTHFSLPASSHASSHSSSSSSHSSSHSSSSRSHSSSHHR